MVLHSLNPISVNGLDSFSYYENIVKSKQKEKKVILYGVKMKGGTLNYSSLYEIMKMKYKIFDTNLHQLEILSAGTFAEDEKEALHHCYTSPTKALNDLKDTIIASQIPFYQNKCAYCGIGGIDSMDHYVPKEKYPEYSVHPLNLVPSCSKCNSKKSDLFIKNRCREIFNPYCDKEERQVLEITINQGDSPKKITFKIDYLHNSYKEHIVRLGIAKKYESEAINIFSSLTGILISGFYGFSQDSSSLENYNKNMKKQLNKSILEVRDERGINSIDYLVYKAFYNSEYNDIKVLIEKLGNPNDNKHLLQFIEQTAK
ncbi:HNH endonuclease [Carnobacterium maltaromaticum]|uniref:HNH endonuclease n=1 Tax=Carnobacterium maltaromaticum TaxID=2751 RepID=UPI0039B05919